tara:strand:- start:196 stop:696 length:501 start_codon:yes stop_codon:yes gene_type:complete
MTRSVITNTGVSGITISSANEITMPSQPAFMVLNGTDLLNIPTNNTESTVKFDSARFDLNSDFNTTTFLFTAPVTGKYQMNVCLNISQVDTVPTLYSIRLITSNKNYIIQFDPEFDDDCLFFCNGSFLVDMDASDTAKVTIGQDGGTSQTDVRADPGSHFSGYLVA